VPQQVARLFGVHPGSVMTLVTDAGQHVDLVVSGIIGPDASALFWATGTATATPFQAPQSPCHQWEGSVVTGSAGLTGLAAILAGRGVETSWYWPVEVANLRADGASALSAAISAVGTQSLFPAQTAASFGFGAGRYSLALSAPLTMTSQLPGALSQIQAQLATVQSLDDLVIGGLFAAGLLLMLLCAALVADRFAAEFALVRARGGSMWQVVTGALRRSTGAGLPGAAAGVAIGLLAVRTASTSMAGWILPALTALLAVASTPAICAWRVRRGTAGQPPGRADLATAGRPARRVVAELAVVAATAAAVAALLVRGTGTGSNQLAFACPTLLAATASIIVARLYPVPIRALLPAAGAGRGSVTFLGLTAAGRSRLRAITPAATLVLTMSLAVLGWLLTLSVSSGNITSSWTQTGADAVITAPGAGTVTPTDIRAVNTVPGVTHTAAAVGP
jgi:putative ABC transport system permease protein